MSFDVTNHIGIGLALDGVVIHCIEESRCHSCRCVRTNNIVVIQLCPWSGEHG
jgi:hypothetical protein